MPKTTIFLPTNFGIWAGPGYACGQYRPDTTTFARLFDRNTGVKPVGFLDAAARNHDLAYEYAERAYGPNSQFSGTDKQKQEMRDQVQLLADLDLMANALQFHPAADDFIGRQYRDMVIKGFYFVAVREYGMGAHMDRLWKSYLQAYDPSYSQPNISDTPFIGTVGLIGAIPDVNTAMSWGTTGLELLTTSDFLSDAQRQSNWGLTEQEMLLFNQHVGTGAVLKPLVSSSNPPEWEYGGELNPKDGGLLVDMVGTVAIPMYAGAWSGYGEQSDKTFVYVGHLNGAKVTMALLNVDDPANRNFVMVTESGGMTTKVKWTAINGQLPDDFGNRPYAKTTSILQAEGYWDPLATESVAAPITPTLKESLIPLSRWTDKVTSILTDANTWSNLNGLDALDKASFQTLFSTYPTPTNYTLEDILDVQKQKYPDAASLSAAALTSVELRFALLRLEPFIRKGGDFATLNANGELDIRDPATGRGEMTKEYLADRATLLFQTMHDPRSIETYPTRFEDAFLDFKYGSPTAAKKVLFGKDAADTLTAGTSDSHLYGGAGNDTLTGNGGNDYLEGNAGIDTLSGGEDADTLYGGKEDDILDGGAGDDLYIINSGDGVDHIKDSGRNRIQYNGQLLAGAFVQDTAGGAYTFIADNGKKIEFHSPGVLTLDGTTRLVFDNQTSSAGFANGDFGIRLIDAAATNGLTLKGDLAPTTSPVRYDALGNVIVDPNRAMLNRADTLNGATGNDRIEGLGGADIVNGYAGNDLLAGGAGADILVGGLGEDRLYANVQATLDANATQTNEGAELLAGGSGDDLLVGSGGNDLLLGGEGRDVLIGGSGADNLLGDVDADQISRTWSATRTLIPQGGSVDYHLNYSNMATSEAQGADDVLYGGAGDDWLKGGGGNDILDGGADADILFGEAGNDTLLGGGGNDILNGDGGTQQGDDWLAGGAGDDTLYGMGGQDRLYGEAGSDLLAGGEGNDSLDGGADDDQLHGEAGNDILLGGAGNDSLQGGDGNDTLDGGAGADELNGGAGDDTYLVTSGQAPLNSAVENITDSSGTDTVRLQGFDPTTLKAYAVNTDDLLLADNANRIVIVDGLNGAIERFELNGETLGHTQMIGRFAAGPLQGTNAEGRRWHYGGKGNDNLSSLVGNAILAGGAGDDGLNLQGNNNIILYGRGDGTDHVLTGGAGNVLRLGPGISAADLTLGLGSLAIQVGSDANDTIHFDSFDANAVLARKPFDHVEFAPSTGSGQSGSTLSYEALLGQGFDLTGTAGNDTIAGTNVNDRITGGTGNDTLSGGAGDDRYRFALGDGQDRIIDTAGADTVAFGPGLNVADLTAAQRTDAEGRWLDLGFAGGASFLKSRRWRHGDSTAPANNDNAWRSAA